MIIIFLDLNPASFGVRTPKRRQGHIVKLQNRRIDTCAQVEKTSTSSNSKQYIFELVEILVISKQD